MKNYYNGAIVFMWLLKWIFKDKWHFAYCKNVFYVQTSKFDSVVNHFLIREY